MTKTNYFRISAAVLALALSALVITHIFLWSECIVQKKTARA